MRTTDEKRQLRVFTTKVRLQQKREILVTAVELVSGLPIHPCYLRTVTEPSEVRLK